MGKLDDLKLAKEKLIKEAAERIKTLQKEIDERQAEIKEIQELVGTEIKPKGKGGRPVGYSPKKKEQKEPVS